jgi:hypothetical protein
MSETYIYGGRPAQTKKAEGITGMLIHGSEGYKFRVYGEGNSFTDYKIIHDDLSITIDQRD